MTGDVGRLVGRNHERAALRELLEHALSEHGRTALVLGEAGIGKTALVEDLARDATAAGARVAWGRCAESDAPVFWPWRQALQSLGCGALDHGDAASSRAEHFAQVVDDLGSLGDGTLIILEDVHWADPASLALFRFVLGSTPGLPLFMVATARDDPLEATADQHRELSRLPPAVERIPVTALDEDAVAQLVTRVVGEEPDIEYARRVTQRCGGNPFFVREVAKLQAANGSGATPTVPAGVRQVLQRRLTRLSDRCRDAIVAAAVIEEPDPDLLAAVLGWPDSSVLHALGEAVTPGLLVPSDDGLRFAHALVRETSLALQDPDRLAGLHRSVAEALEHRWDLDEGRLHGRLARHWRRAAGSDAPGHAARHALIAAREARQRMGYEQAVRYYQQALQGPLDDDPLPIQRELGEAEILAGDLEAGRGRLRSTAHEAHAQGRPRLVARAVLALGTGVGGFEVEIADADQVQLLDSVLEKMDDDDPLRPAVLARLSLVAAFLRDVDERVALAEKAIELARSTGDASTQVAALAAWCDARSGPDDLDERLLRTDEMLRIAHRADDVGSLMLARRQRIVALAEHGDFDEMDAEVTAYQHAAQRLQIPLYGWYVPMWRGMRTLMAGDDASAVRHLEELEQLGSEAGSANATLMRLALHAELLKANEAFDEALALAEQGAELVDPYLDAWMAEMLALAGQTDRAQARLPRAMELIRSFPDDAEYLSILCYLSGAAILLEDLDTAEEVYDHMLPYADLWAIAGVGSTCGCVVSHELGRLATLLERPDDAEAHLAHALDAHRSAGATHLAELTEQAIAELAEGRPRQARRRSSEGDRGTLRRSGKVWQLQWLGDAVTVPDTKGIRDLAVLVSTPGRDVAALDLVEAAGGPPAAAAGGGHAGEQLDQQARRAYKRRIEELEDEIAEAEAFHDAGRLDKLRTEQEWLARELAAAVGLGGRPRRQGDPVERARKAVTMRLRTALKAIREVDPDLAHHLDRSINTGRFCSYRPEHPTTWTVVP